MKSGSRRNALNTLFASASALAATLLPFAAHAQAPYPSKTVKFIVPYSAGGLPDTVARIVAQRLQERLGQSFVVDNRPGANGSVAAGVLATSQADGYTFLLTDGSMLSINPLLYTKLSYDPNKDYVPVALLARAPLFLAVHPKVPVSSMKEFIDYVKARPGQINYGSSGVGSTHHLSMEAIKSSLGLDMTHIPYKGTGQSVPALIGGQVEVLFSAYPSLAAFAKDNRIKLIAINAAQRSSQAPDLAPISDFIPGFDFAPIVGILALAGTPTAAVEKIAAEANAVLKLPEVVQQFEKVGVEVVGGGPAEYGRAIASENERVAKVVKSAAIKPE